MGSFTERALQIREEIDAMKTENLELIELLGKLAEEEYNKALEEIG